MARPDSAAHPAGTASISNGGEIDAQGGGREGYGGYTVRLSSGVGSFGYPEHDYIAGGNNNDDDDDVYKSGNDGYKQCGGNETVVVGGGNETVGGGRSETVGGNGANDEHDRGGYKQGGNETVGWNGTLGNETVGGVNGNVGDGNETVGVGNETVVNGNETVGRDETVGGRNETVGQAGRGIGHGEEEWRYTSTILTSPDGADNQPETATGSENAPPESEPAPVATAKGKNEAGVPQTQMAAFMRDGEREGLSGGRNFSLEVRNHSTGFAATGGAGEDGGMGLPVLREDGGLGFAKMRGGGEGTTGFATTREDEGGTAGFSATKEEGERGVQGEGRNGSGKPLGAGMLGMGLGLGLGGRSKSSIFRQSSGHLASLATASASLGQGEFREGLGRRPGECKAFFLCR